MPAQAAAPPRGRSSNCGPWRAAGLLCHIQVVKEQRRRIRLREKIWYPTRDSNPEEPVSETGAYADSASGAQQKQKARGPCGSPGLGETASDRWVARRSAPFRARADPPRQGRCLSFASNTFYASNSYLRSPNAVLAAALTPQKQKTRSARAVRVRMGAKRLSDPRLRTGVFKTKSLRMRVHGQVGAHSVPGLFRCQQKFRFSARAACRTRCRRGAPRGRRW